MLLNELFNTIREAEAPKQKGRAFNHPEHFVFFHGSEGAVEALHHYHEVAGELAGGTSLRMKWDGNPQIYWGRETKGGPLILAGHNGWSRGAKTDSPDAVKDFIANKSGSPKTPEEQEERNRFAQEFASLYPIFNKATPRDFVGFVYADGLFLQPPGLDDQGIYTFCPNPHSKTCYHVKPTSELGKRIQRAKVMVVGHAYFPEFGLPDREQKPIQDFSHFNNTPELIVQPPITNVEAPKYEMPKPVAEIQSLIKSNGSQIDSFLSSIPDPDKEGIFYKFANSMSKKGSAVFDRVDNKVFFDWMKDPANKISPKKAAHIEATAKQQGNGLTAIWELIKKLRHLKDAQHGALQAQPKPDIWDSNGEGYVRYADPGKHKFGNVKFVPTTWTPK